MRNLAVSGIPLAAAFAAKQPDVLFHVISPFAHARVSSIACLGRLSSALACSTGAVRVLHNRQPIMQVNNDLNQLKFHPALWL
jgi:hypothetical protein